MTDTHLTNPLTTETTIDTITSELPASDDLLLRWYQCERKHAFPTLTTASTYADHLTFHPETIPRNGHNPNILPYQCDHCNHYHVGQISFHVSSRRRQLRNARSEWLHTLPEQRYPSGHAPDSLPTLHPRSEPTKQQPIPAS